MELKHSISNQQNLPCFEGKQEALIIKIFNKWQQNKKAPFFKEAFKE